VAARSVSLARYAVGVGGAISAAVLVIEANAIHSTLKSIHDGSPCEKANELRRVLQDLQHFPTSSELDGECQAYLKVLADCAPPPIVEASAVSDNLSAETSITEAICEEGTGGGSCLPSPSVIIERDVPGPDSSTSRGQPPVSAYSATSSFVGGDSRMQRFHGRWELHQHMNV
jgi:hypothetical protein